ncbi:MAG: helicase associated domain-containing protein [Tenericutes bacterium]|nr:helicase associated domain-containing protein [Mycoplasmatota bacterium]
MIYENDWPLKYKEAVKFYEKNGHLRVPNTYTQNGINLGRWIQIQRQLYKKNKVTYDRVVLLNKIGMVWNLDRSLKYNLKWALVYKEVLKYYEENGNIEIPIDYFVIINDEEVYLNNWIAVQRTMFLQGKLSLDKKEMLDKVGMVWKIRNRYSWDKMFSLALDYYSLNGNLFIPKNYQVIVNGETINLGTWVTNQRRNYKAGVLAPLRISKLEEIGMVWEDVKVASNNKRWLIMYKEALRYLEENGNLKVPSDYVVTIDDEVYLLNSWIRQQKSHLLNGTLVGKRKELMEGLVNLLDNRRKSM